MYVCIYIYIYIYMYVLLKALLPVCMKYTAQDKSRVANICSTRRSRVLYLSQDSHQELYILYQMKRQCFECFIVFYTYQSVNKNRSLIILTHLLNKQIVFFDKMCQ